MKAESLRIGNLVSYADQETLVLDILRTHVELGYFKDSIGFERRYDEFQPIPLTEEWLLKFGFEENQCYRKGSNRYCLYLGSSCQIRVNLYKDLDHDVILFSGDEFEKSSKLLLSNIKHVHQLQNLYFALTGIELKTE